MGTDEESKPFIRTQFLGSLAPKRGGQLLPAPLP